MTDQGTSPRPRSGRRASRFEELFSLRRAVSLPILLLAALTAILYAVNPGTDPERVGGACFAAALAGLALWCFRRDRWLAFLLLVPLALFHFGYFGLRVLQSEWTLSPRLLVGAIFVLNGAAALTLVLSGLRILAPARAMLLGLAIAVALLGAEAAMQFPRDLALAAPADAPAPPAPSPDGATGERGAPPTDPADPEDAPSFRPAPQEWSGPPCRPHPELEHIGAANSIVRAYYPDDPRGYFEKEDFFGPLPPERWNLEALEGAEGRMVRNQPKRGAFRVEVLSPGPNRWSLIAGASGLRLGAERRYLLSFSARADAPRTVELVAAQAEAPFQKLGPERVLRLDQKWRRFQHVFAPAVDENNARWRLQLGGDAAAIEVSDAVLLPLERAPTPLGAPEPGSLRISENDGAAGMLASDPKESERIRVEVLKPGTLGWHLQVQWPGIPVERDRPYVLSFRARADRGRTVPVFLMQAHPPWQSLKFYQRLPLETEWKDFQFEVRPAASEPDAQIAFDAGGEPVSFEIEDLWFVPASDSARTSEAAEHWTPGDGGPCRLVIERPRPMRSDATRFRLLPQQGQGGDSISGCIGRASRPLGPLEADVRYALWLHVKAPAPANVEVHVEAPRGAALSGGPARFDVNASRELVYLEFTPKVAAKEGALTLEFSGASAIDVDEVHLVPLGDARTRYAQRHAVAYAFNSVGFRDDEHPLQTPPGVFRIACIGDSYVCGIGVHAPDVFTRVLEKSLNARARSDGLRYEVLNFGIPGWETRQERTCYNRIASAYQPRLVVLFMVDNDDMTSSEEKAAGFYDEPNKAEESFGVLKLIRKHTRPKRPGYARCVEAIRGLQEDCAQKGARLAVVIFHDADRKTFVEMTDTVTKGLEGSGIPLLNLRDALLTNRKPGELAVHPIDAHPNEEAHRIAAREVERFLRERGLLDAPPALGSR